MAEPKKILKVFDKDGLYKTMAVESKTTAGEVCEKLGKKLFMNEGDKEQFGLFVFEGGVKQSLKMTDFPYDYIIKMERKEYKFYFLNSKGEFMSFQERVASQLTATATGKAPTREPPQPGGPPTREPPSPVNKSSSVMDMKPSKGMSGYMLRKKANKFDKVWVESKDKYLRFYPSQEDSTPTHELSLENAVIELKVSQLGSFIVVTLSNSERHTLAADKEGDLQAWATELQCTTAYEAVKSAQVRVNTVQQGMGMPFVPKIGDLSSGLNKLHQKLENYNTQSRALISWTNYIISGRSPSITISNTSDIISCYSDGLILVNVIDQLFNRQVKFRKGKSVYEMQHNVENILEALKGCGADFGKMIAQDIVECKVGKVIQRLIWSIFVAFISRGQKEYVVKDKLIGWCGRKTVEQKIAVDSAAALSNPLAFAVLLSKYPSTSSMIDFNQLSRKSKQEQAQTILDVAYNGLKIPKILEASDWSEDKMDERSFMLYLSFFYYFMGEDAEHANIIKNCTSSKDAIEGESMVSVRDKALKAQREKDEEDRLKKEELTRQQKQAKEDLERRQREDQERVKRQNEDHQQQVQNQQREKAQLEKERLAKQKQQQQEREKAEEEQRERLRKQAEEREAIKRAKEAEEEEETRRRIEEEEEELRELERAHKENQMADEWERLRQEQLERERIRQEEEEDDERRRLEEEEELRRLEEEEEEEKRMILEQEAMQRELQRLKLEEEAEKKRGEELNSVSQFEHEQQQYQTKPKLSLIGGKLVGERESLVNVFDMLEEELDSFNEDSVARLNRSASTLPKQETIPNNQNQNNNIKSNHNSLADDDDEVIDGSELGFNSNQSQQQQQSQHQPQMQQQHQQQEQEQEPSPPSSPQSQPQLSNTDSSNNLNNEPDGANQSRGKVVVRICLEGFGDVLFCSFAIGYETLCGKVRQMVVKKMKVPAEDESYYSLHIVRDGLERVLDDDEILLEAEDKIDRFVFKKNDLFDRVSLISSHRS